MDGKKNCSKLLFFFCLPFLFYFRYCSALLWVTHTRSRNSVLIFFSLSGTCTHARTHARTQVYFCEQWTPPAFYHVPIKTKETHSFFFFWLCSYQLLYDVRSATKRRVISSFFFFCFPVAAIRDKHIDVRWAFALRFWSQLLQARCTLPASFGFFFFTYSLSFF